MSDGVRAPTIEGLLVAAVGMVGHELGLCCALPHPFTRGVVSSVVVTMGRECYRVGLRSTGYDVGCGAPQFAVVTAEAAPLGFFFGLNPWLVRG